MPGPVLVTGGAGFIGAALVSRLLENGAPRVVTVDAMTYAGNPDAVAALAGDARHRFYRLDVTDRGALARVFADERPERVFHLAAETHVDRSIVDPSPFFLSNVAGTQSVLAVARAHYERLGAEERASFRLLHASTDEVYGALGPDGLFTEESPYRPSSPYAASKAASDHLVRAWHRTYGLPTLVTHGSNVFGPWQFPEKLVPVVVTRALAGRRIPIYGRGDNVRDWLYVDDHVRALVAVMDRGTPGDSYNIGGRRELTNLALVEHLCDTLDQVLPARPFGSHRTLVEHVADRPGHDFRYAVDSRKIESATGWRPEADFARAIASTVAWYREHLDWVLRMELRVRPASAPPEK